MARKSVSTFWHGAAPSNYEKACLLSFAGHGFEVVLYSFQPIVGLPDKIDNRDASAIDGGALLDRFIYRGKPNLQHYSDLFRMKLLASQDTTWIDSDVVLLDAERFLAPDLIIGKEDESIICNAVLRIDSTDSMLGEIVGQIEGMADTELRWGETGHVILMNAVARHRRERELNAAETFYPIHWHEFWKPFLPEFADECAELSAKAATLHLWSNLITQMGVYKRIGPPEESFLHRALAKSGALSAFDDFYPADVMYRMAENWVARDGEDLGVKRVLRLVGSSIVNTYQRKIRRDERPFLSKRLSRSPLAGGRYQQSN